MNLDLYSKEGVESLRILLYTFINVHLVNGQWLKFNIVNGQSPKKSAWSTVKLQKEACQSFDLGVTPPVL